jgi:hypothetical protein
MDAPRSSRSRILDPEDAFVLGLGLLLTVQAMLWGIALPAARWSASALAGAGAVLVAASAWLAAIAVTRGWRRDLLGHPALLFAGLAGGFLVGVLWPMPDWPRAGIALALAVGLAGIAVCVKAVWWRIEDALPSRRRGFPP